MQDRGDGNLNYADLIARVESEIFRDPDIPKGLININAEFGKIVLHGEVADEKQAAHVVEVIRQVPGVQDVISYLHPQGTPAPQEQPRPGNLGELPS